MKEILLTQGYIALVDDEDYNLISQYKWCIKKDKGRYYAKTSIYYAEDKKQKWLFMHQLIMGTTLGKEVDHKNGNGLDNRKENLRFCTRTENLCNQISRCGSSSYKGVSWQKNAHKWVAYIRHNKKRTYLGLYKDEIEAAKVYDKAAIEYFGEYARLNFNKEEYNRG